LGVDNSLRAGRRDLSGGSSLAILLAEHRGVRNLKGLPPLTIKQILAWVDAHNVAAGEWPNQYSGQVTDTDKIMVGWSKPCAIQSPRKNHDSPAVAASRLSAGQLHDDIPYLCRRR
jgi:hypothetical protein